MTSWKNGAVRPLPSSLRHRVLLSASGHRADACPVGRSFPNTAPNQLSLVIYEEFMRGVPLPCAVPVRSRGPGVRERDCSVTAGPETGGRADRTRRRTHGKLRHYRSLSIKARFGLHRQIAATGPPHPHRRQAGRCQSRPLAQSPLRTAPVGLCDPLHWLILHITRLGGGGESTRWPVSALGDRGWTPQAHTPRRARRRTGHKRCIQTAA